ncbi:MAG TPA: hypothetical protein VLA19_08980, partial [Herpetosiphonaceae bacterium]|nr:hypothetical protein [Herpetosiphonaceae bacterium]
PLGQTQALALGLAHRQRAQERWGTPPPVRRLSASSEPGCAAVLNSPPVSLSTLVANPSRRRTDAGLRSA